MNEAHKQARAYWAIIAGLAEGLEALFKAIDIKLDYFFALVDDKGEVANRDRAALQEAVARGADIIELSPLVAKEYFPKRRRSFNLADATPAELKHCCDVAKEQADQDRFLDGTLPC